MKTTIDGAGRIVVPREIRVAAHLTPGATVDIRLVDGTVEIEVAAEPLRIERRGGLLVAAAHGRRPALTDETVTATQSAIRARRGRTGPDAG